MIWVVVLALIGGCVSTPLQQGNLKIVKYTANRDGLFPQNDGIPIAPQPIIYNPQQPYLIQEPSPLTYSAVGGSVLTERDQQRHINIDDEVEAREEGADDESKPVEEPKVDTNVDSKDESVVSVDDQKPVQTETAALVGSNILPVKGGVQTFGIGNDQIFPSVISGQRRLIEPQPQLYSVKGKISPSLIPSYHQQVVPQQRVVYHSVQQQQYPVHQVPVQVEEHKISPHGVQVRKPVIQYQQVNPVQKPFVPREWLRKPIQQGVKGHQQVQQHQQQIQYFIQPVISSDLGLPVDQSQVYGVQPNYQGVKILQRQEEINKLNVPKRQDVDQVGVPVVNIQDRDDQQGVQDLGVNVQQQQQQPRQDVLTQKQGVKSPVDHSVHKVVVQTSQHQVPVVGQPQVIGYQLVGHQQPQQILVQQPIQHSLVSPISQQNVQYVPISDIQQYYQLIQSVPLQSVGQHYSYIQSPQVIDQPIQYTSGQVSPNGQPIQSQVVQPNDQTVGVVGGVHGSQRIVGFGVPQNQEDRSGVKGHNSAPVDQRRQRSFIGVKGGINV